MQFKTSGTRGRGKRLAGVLTAAAFNVVLLALLIHLQTFPSAVGAAQIPTVAVAAQRDVPLTIFVEGYDFSGSSSLQIRYRVQNANNKAIRAYTILEKIEWDKGATTGASIVNLGEETKFLRPAQSRVETCDLPSQDGPVTRLTLSVDYVEFDDATTWGTDTRRSADYLAGQREGRAATFKKVKELRERNGDPAVEELLKKKDAEVVVLPAARSTEWQYGFRVGHNSALHQLRAAHLKGGLQGWASELHREVENLERRRQ